MKVTYNWLKDFVEIKISPETLADKLTMAGLEVVSLSRKDGDFVFEIEITSNRPDWLSVIGIAREVAAITAKKIKLSKTKTPQIQKEIKDFIVEIEDKKDCPLYCAKIIKGVKVGPSPDWLKKRLELIGCRSINNIVDITNYVLFELGEPLHAFDFDKLQQDAIIVRRGRKDEKIATLDGQVLTLDQNTLMIADKNKAVAVAGVMGGKDTEVTEGTKNILLEAAIFNPVIIRRARQALGIQSDAAYRFERGIDAGIVEKSSSRAQELILELAGGRCVLDKASSKPKIKTREVVLDVSRAKKILGISISSNNAGKILNNLGFRAKTKSKNILKVLTPSYRQDVTQEIDLVEELARVYGFENIPRTLPFVLPRVEINTSQDMVSLAKNILIGLGLNEVITYSLVDSDLLRIFEREEPNAIGIKNPLSKEQEALRPRLIPSLLTRIAYNLNQKQEYVNIFEVAKVFYASGNVPCEELNLGIALCGTKSLLLQQGQIKEESGILHLKGILEILLERLGIKNYIFEALPQANTFSIKINQQNLGIMMQLPSSVLDKLDIKNKNVFGLEISLEKLFGFAKLEKKFAPLPKFPGITRDISFILKENISIESLMDAIKEKGKPLLRSVSIADYYKGKQIPEGFRGLTISCFYQSDERTLIEAEVNSVQGLIVNLLSEQFGAKMR